MKSSFDEILAAWDTARLSATSFEDFQAKWTESLTRLGWTREDFHVELDRLHTETYAIDG